MQCFAQCLEHIWKSMNINCYYYIIKKGHWIWEDYFQIASGKQLVNYLGVTKEIHGWDVQVTSEDPVQVQKKLQQEQRYLGWYWELDNVGKRKVITEIAEMGGWSKGSSNDTDIEGLEENRLGVGAQNQRRWEAGSEVKQWDGYKGKKLTHFPWHQRKELEQEFTLCGPWPHSFGTTRNYWKCDFPAPSQTDCSKKP